jgi:hypothetical protein
MRLIITKHAQQRMDLNGITEDQIRMAIQRGAKTVQTEGFLVVYTYIRVAYRIINDKYIIKTVMIEK